MTIKISIKNDQVSHSNQVVDVLQEELLASGQWGSSDLLSTLQCGEVFEGYVHSHRRFRVSERVL